MADTAPERPRLAGADVSATLQQALAILFPSNLAAKAALFVVVVALLPLLPSSQGSRIWDLPHLLLLGIIISYGVFGQKNGDAEAAVVVAKPVADDESVEAYVSQMMQGSPVFEGDDGDGEGDGGGAKDGLQAWSSQYLPDEPLVVVADAGGNNDQDEANEEPLLPPARTPKPAAKESAKFTGDISDIIEEDEEEEFLAPKAGYAVVREHAIPSPSSILEADLALSPSSPPLLPPPPPPFLGAGSRLQKPKARSFNDFGIGNRSMSGRLGYNYKQLRSKSAVQERSTFTGNDPAAAIDDEEDDRELDEAAVASDSSFSSDTVTDVDDNNDKEGDGYDEVEGEDDGDSCDEELFELATRPGPEAEEVDRKAEEFIARFKEQIRMQRAEPARR